MWCRSAILAKIYTHRWIAHATSKQVWQDLNDISVCHNFECMRCEMKGDLEKN
jgi:hypothetical protein